MSIADKLTLLASTKEAQRIKLGLATSVPFSAYVNSINPDWSVLDLFKTGSEGVWYDPSDLSTLFQDAAGTIPVTANGNPVGKMLDKSGNGNHAVQDVSARRVTYRTGGGLHWLAFDGVDDSISSIAFDTVLTQPLVMTVAVKSATVIPQFKFIFDSSKPNRLSLLYINTGATQFSAGTPVDTDILKTTVKAVYQFRANGASSALYRNNEAVGRGNAGASGTKDIMIGRIDTDPVYGNPSMDFYGMVLAKGMSSVDEFRVKEYLAKKSGVIL